MKRPQPHIASCPISGSPVYDAEHRRCRERDLRRLEELKVLEAEHEETVRRREKV